MCPIIPQPDVRKAAFRTRQIDYCYQWDFTEAEDFQKDHPEVVLYEYYSNSYARLVFACDRPPFNDKRVRQAASMCLDRQKVMNLVYEGHGVLENHIARAVWGSLPHDKLGKAKKYLTADVEEAKKLLKAAGYKLPLKISFVYANAYVATYRSAAEAYIGMLNSSGAFQVTTVAKEYGAYIKSNFRGNYKEDCFYALTTPPMDADGFLYDMYHSKGPKNGARLKDPHMDELIEAQRREINEEKRLKILHEIQLYMAEQMFTAPVQASAMNDVMWGDVIKHYKPHLVPSYNIGDRFRLAWRAK
jgi:peptide/nickel transport system substrate-binding protein